MHEQLIPGHWIIGVGGLNWQSKAHKHFNISERLGHANNGTKMLGNSNDPD